MPLRIGPVPIRSGSAHPQASALQRVMLELPGDQHPLDLA